MEWLLSATDALVMSDYALAAAGIVVHKTSARNAATTGLMIKQYDLPDLVPGGQTAWNALLQQSSLESVCLHWKWMSLWRKYFYRDNMQAVILGVHDGVELVGILPLVLIRDETARLSKRKLCFFGTGEPETEEITTEYVDVMAKPGYETRVSEAAANYLYTNFTEWDVLELLRYRQNSLINNYFLPAMRKYGARQHVYTCGYRHFLPISSDYKSYVASRSRAFRRNLVNGINTLNTSGHVEYRLINSHDQIEVFLQALKTMHLKRFRGMHRISAFESAIFTSYHRDLLHYLLGQDQVMMLVCELDGKIIAAEYVMLFDQNAYAYQGGFESDVQKISPGFLSINKAIELVSDRNLKMFDFMLGAEDSYATSYGCQRETMSTVVIYNRHVRNYISYIKVISKMHLKGAWIISKGLIERLRERKRRVNHPA